MKKIDVCVKNIKDDKLELLLSNVLLDITYALFYE